MFLCSLLAFQILSIQEQPYLNFVERSKRVTHRLRDYCEEDNEKTSRTIIRPAWLRLLPGVHLQSIYQVFFLGS